MTEMDKQAIDNLRKAMGTLPNRTIKKNYRYENCLNTCHVQLRDWPKNPFKNIVNMVTSTWGEGTEFDGSGATKKWEQLTPENRYRVVISTLTGNTMTIPLESINFVFEHNGSPRHTFDQFARARIGTSISSIGCRDNSKIDAPFLLYPALYTALENDPKLKKKFENWAKTTKDMYETILHSGNGSYQEARSVLPMSYNHSWVTSINYLALRGQCTRRMMACEEAPIVLLFWKMRKEVKDKVSPLLANYLRPACDGAKKCIYSGGADGLTKYFSNLFSGCGRWAGEHKYSEFDRSCTSFYELAKHTEIVQPTGWINYGLNDYAKLSIRDKKLFEQP